MPLRLKRDSLGRTEIVGDADDGPSLLSQVSPPRGTSALLTIGKSDRPEFPVMAELKWREGTMASGVGIFYGGSPEEVATQARTFAAERGLKISLMRKATVTTRAPTPATIHGDDDDDDDEGYDLQETGLERPGNPALGFRMTEPGNRESFTVVGSTTTRERRKKVQMVENLGLYRNHMGHTEIVGSGDLMGMLPLFSANTGVATYTPVQPTRYGTSVYAQRQYRGGGKTFWNRETDLEATTAAEAEKKAKDYLAAHKWSYETPPG